MIYANAYIQKECRSTPFVQIPSIFLHLDGLKGHSVDLNWLVGIRVYKIQTNDQTAV